MNESDARAHFRAMGIPRPSRCLIDAWLRAAKLERQITDAEKPPTAKAENSVAAANTNRGPTAPQTDPSSPAPRGKSLLEPILRHRGDLPNPPKRRKPGRPRLVASWFPAVAKTMADGTTLRTALAMNRLTLSANEMRSLYRNKTFRGLYQETRRRFLIENWGRSKVPSLRSVLGRRL
jgi:hypothetical protein